MQEIGLPVEIVDARGDLGRSQAEPGEADVVVGPVEAGGVAVGRALAVVELRAQHHVDDETVGASVRTDLASRQAARGRQPADDRQSSAVPSTWR